MCVGILLDLRFDENLNDELRRSPHPPPSAQNGVIKHGRLAFSHSSTVFRDGRFAVTLDWGNSATPLSLRLLGFQSSFPWLVFPCVVFSNLSITCLSSLLPFTATGAAPNNSDPENLRSERSQESWRSRRSSSRQ
jgi:hypothetical protein